MFRGELSVAMRAHRRLTSRGVHPDEAANLIERTEGSLATLDPYELADAILEQRRKEAELRTGPAAREYVQRQTDQLERSRRLREQTAGAR